MWPPPPPPPPPGHPHHLPSGPPPPPPPGTYPGPTTFAPQFGPGASEYRVESGQEPYSRPSSVASTVSSLPYSAYPQPPQRFPRDPSFGTSRPVSTPQTNMMVPFDRNTYSSHQSFRQLRPDGNTECLYPAGSQLHSRFTGHSYRRHDPNDQLGQTFESLQHLVEQPNAMVRGYFDVGPDGGHILYQGSVSIGGNSHPLHCKHFTFPSTEYT